MYQRILHEINVGCRETGMAVSQIVVPEAQETLIETEGEDPGMCCPDPPVPDLQGLGVV